jgi:hypothetical protein
MYVDLNCSGMFIFPILKGDGHMWVVSQFQDTAFIVTYLGGKGVIQQL